MSGPLTPEQEELYRQLTGSRDRAADPAATGRTCWYPVNLTPLEDCGDTAVFSVLRHEQRDRRAARDSRDCCRRHLAATVDAVDDENPGYVVHVNVIATTDQRAAQDSGRPEHAPGQPEWPPPSKWPGRPSSPGPWVLPERVPGPGQD